MSPEKLQIIMAIFPMIAIIVSVSVGASVLNTWLRIRNGYPLENSWGKAIHPQKNAETAERVTLLTQENAQLRAELGSIKDRLATVERIVTDGATQLSHQIEQLRDRRAN
jgi:hypothetical protein